MDIHDVIIVGAGPAGIACAIQLKRYGLNPIILEKNEPGGILKNAYKIENYPGFPEGISGTKLVSLLKKQINRFLIDIHYEEVVSIDYKDFTFVIKTDKQIYNAITLVLATGTVPVKFEYPEIPFDADGKIFHEIYPILDTHNKKIAIIGAGDAAFDYALSLGKHNTVLIINRSNTTKCLQILNDECEKNPNIFYKPHTTLENISTEGDRLKIICNCKGERKTYYLNYLVPAIGRTTDLSLFSNTIAKNFHDLINSKRLFLIGDINNGKYRQLSISVGDGVKAAMEIFQEINF